MNWQQWMYNQIYRRGATRWDSNTASIPNDVQQLIESVHTSPTSRALDLGCGTGSMAIALAQEGWQVVGVDFSSVAIAAARAKAAGIAGVTFVEGDVSRLAANGVHGPFDLAYDLGCYHALPTNRRQAYVQELARVLRPGGLFLLWAYSGGRLFLVPGAPSMAETEVSDRFGADFTVEEAQKRGMGKGGNREATFYALRRR
ncbi:MAG: class I SAM-dependent methyltransferase [Ktedonobacterales bacterium]